MNNYSLIIPVVDNFIYNKFIYKNIRSQYPKVEIVIVSKSSDETDQYFEEILDPNLIFEAHTKNTLSSAYNLAVSLSTKEKLVLLHNDMYLGPKFLEGIEDSLTDNNIVTYTRVEPPIYIDTYAGKEILDCGLSPEVFNESKFLSHCETSSRKVINGGSQLFFAVYKKNYIGLDGHTFKMFCEDEDIHLRYKLLGFKSISTESSRCYHFVSKTSRSIDNSAIERDSNLKFIKKWGFRNSKHNVYYKKKFILHFFHPQIKSAVKPWFNGGEDIIVEIDPNHFDQKDMDYVQNLNDHIKEEGRTGILKINNLRVTVNSLNEYQNDLIWESSA
tara:strand:- start:1 stop:990 length:990 start_codon:yes stop_codon:yes gene_type:complete